MMTCQQLADLLLEFITEELETGHADAIRVHLQGCTSCEAFVDSYRILITLPRQLPPLPLRADFARRLEDLRRQLKDSAG